MWTLRPRQASLAACTPSAPAGRVKPETHYMIFGVLNAPTRFLPFRGELQIHLATKLKYLEDSNNDPGNAPHKVAGAKGYISPAKSPVYSQ